VNDLFGFNSKEQGKEKLNIPGDPAGGDGRAPKEDTTIL
jgi:hypothetical protein